MNNLSENTDREKVKLLFRKNERLCSKKVIDKLFAEGKSVFSFPVKIGYLETKLRANVPAQAAFSVGKRNFKRAVQRNLIKRRMREVYRLNKPEFYSEIGEKQVAVFFIFTGKTISEYSQIEAAVKKGMKKLISELKTSN
jgi:ribonuclease P protein component